MRGCMSSNQLVDIGDVGGQSYCTENIAVGCPEYVEPLLIQRGIKAKGQLIMLVEIERQLKETETAYPYQGLFEDEKGGLSLENAFFRN